MGWEVAAFAVTVLATGASVHQQQQAADEQERARKAKQRMAQVRQQRERRAAIRQAQRKRAQVANVSAQTGTQDTSVAQGAMGSIQSQLGSNLSFLDTMERGGQFITERQNQAAGFTQRASVFEGLASLSQGTGDFVRNNPDFFGGNNSGGQQSTG